MKRLDFLRSLKSPLPNAILKKPPQGNLMQGWGANPRLYSAAYGYDDDLHRFTGGHSGIDIFTFHRDPVYAAHDGVVIAVGDDRTRAVGKNVQIQSDPLDDEEPGNSKVTTMYLHLDEVRVTVGQRVTAGTQVGFEGNTGFVISGGTQYWGTAPAGVGTHLHFQLLELMKRGEVWVPRYVNAMGNTSDPLYYLTGDTAGEATVLQNILQLLMFWRGRGKF